MAFDFRPPPFLGHFSGLSYPSIMIRFPCLLLYIFAMVYLGVLFFLVFRFLLFFFFYFFLELGGLCIFLDIFFFYITSRRAAKLETTEFKTGPAGFRMVKGVYLHIVFFSAVLKA